MDSNHGDQKGCWYANLAGVEKGNENNEDIFNENDSVHQQQFCVADSQLLVVHSIFPFASDNVIVQVKIAYSVDDAVVEDTLSCPLWWGVPRPPVDESHCKHVEDGGSHHRPEISFPPSEGKNDKDDQSGGDLADAGSKEDQPTSKIGRKIESPIHGCCLVAVKRPGKCEAGGYDRPKLKFWHLLGKVGQVCFQKL